ncbi:MAG: hypothetical protein ACJ0BV_10890 [Paracoccaceae bacterium]
MNDSDINYVTGDEAISAFKAKTLSPVELIDAVIDRTVSMLRMKLMLLLTLFSIKLERLLK